MVSEANGGAHKIYNATVHCLIAKKAGKKFIVGDTGAGYAGKMLSMAAKKFGLKCKIFMGAKDIKRQRPNVEAIRKNGAEIVPVTTGSQTLVDAVVSAWDTGFQIVILLICVLVQLWVQIYLLRSALGQLLKFQEN